MKNALVLFCVIFLFASCKKEKQDPNPYADCPYGKTFETLPNAPAMLDGLIPFCIGYTWVYADSTWQDSVLVSARLDTVRVTGAEKSGTDIWWHLSDYYTYCQGHDTIYHLIFPGMYVPGHVVCPEKSALYYPVKPDTVVQWYELISDVVIHGTASVFKPEIITGMGNFSNTIEFSTDSYNGSLKRYIKPGIGIIKVSQVEDGGSWIYEQTLVSVYNPKAR